MDEQYWVPHETEVFLPGRLLKDDGESRTYSTEQGDVSVPAKETLEQIQSSDVLGGVNDICTLDSVTLAGLLHSIRVRYIRDDIYTNISRILIAVNPFKPLSIYDDQKLGEYMSVKNPATLPPHIFGIGADLYHRFSQDGTSQAVLISGESGAGKSESTKLVLLYISQAFGGGDDSGVLQDEILEINPILESFGNAKTVRNNNSSRFGKWIQVLVDPVSKKFKGAMVIDYLLEVTRVCGQGPGERNYHIFYQLMQDSTGDLHHLQLEGGFEKFSYLNNNSAEVGNLNDNENFNMLCKAFSGLSFTQDEQGDIFKIVAGILHLGNVMFTDADESSVGDGSALSTSAALLQIDSEKLAQCMCKKRLVVGKEVTWAPQNQLNAGRARDAIAKLIYGRLFTWLVTKCNQTLGAHLAMQKNNASFPFIGVLDIAGFETFETNSLEQLFINLSNEKLQQFFTNYVFKSEVQEYEAEQLDIGKIEFSDNVDVLNLIEGKGGILLMLDECTFGIRQTDELFTSNVVKAHQKDNNFIKPKFPTDPFFTIRHFAGDVKYTTHGFLEKNVAQKPPEVVELLESSTLDILKQLAAEPESEKQSPKRGSIGTFGKITIGSSFRKSLGQLVEKLGAAQMHFIRCVKPNPESLPGKFASPMVIEQLKLSGIMGAVQIRKIGYSFRQKHEDFMKRFLILLPTALRKKVLGDESLSTVDPSKASLSLLEVLGEVLTSSIAKSDYALGKTKIFLRDSLHHALEMYRRSALVSPVLLVQAVWRGYHVRSKMREVKSIYSEMQKLTTTIDVSNLSEFSCLESSVSAFDVLLTRAQGLPLKLPKIQDFVKFRMKLDSDLNLASQIDAFIRETSLDVLAMQAVLARATANKLGGPLLETLQKHCSAVQEQLPLIHALKSCADANLDSMHILRNCVSDVDAKMSDPEKWIIPEGPQLYKDAVAKLAELEQLQREMRRKAMQEAKAKMLEEAETASKEELKIVFADWVAEIQLGKRIKIAKAKVQTAMKEFNTSELRDVLLEAKNIGASEEELAEAQQLFLSLQDSEFVNQEFLRVSQLESSDGLNALIKSNLSAQYEALTGEIPGIKRGSVVTPAQRSFSEMDFSNLSSFPRLREPDADSWLNHLSWSSQRITQTLTLVEPAFVKSGIQNFMNVMRCMGDKPAAYIGDKQQPVLDLAQHVPALRDEIYIQVLKQLTRNPSAESAKQGWQLLRSLCRSAAPSNDLADYIRAYLKAGLRKVTTDEMVEFNRTTRRSSCGRPSVMRTRSKTYGDMVRDFQGDKAALAGEALDFFNETMAEAEKSAEATQALAGQETQNVEIHVADGTVRNVKVKKGLTLDWLRCHMLDILGIENGNAFELFEADPADSRSPWHLLARSKNVVATMLEAQESKHCICFGRINVLTSEALEVDDVANARLTYEHAVKQFMSCQRLPLAAEDEKPLYVKVATALVSCDRATYEKKQKGGPDSFNARVDQMQAEFEAGLNGDGVLERYLPKPWFQLFDRAVLADAVHEGLTELGAFSENIKGFELMWKSRALSLMQSSCPLLETYTFGSVSFVAKSEIANEQLEWVGQTCEPPQQVLEMDASEKFLLSISHKHIEVIPDADGGETISIPIQLGLESRYLNCWAVIPGDRIAFSFFDFSLPVGLILKVPEGVAEAVGVFLARFQSV